MYLEYLENLIVMLRTVLVYSNGILTNHKTARLYVRHSIGEFPLSVFISEIRLICAKRKDIFLSQKDHNMYCNVLELI